MDTTTIVYSGPHRDGLELSEAYGFGFVPIPYGEPCDVPAPIAEALISERPDEFRLHTPAAARKTTKRTIPASADDQEA